MFPDILLPDCGGGRLNWPDPRSIRCVPVFGERLPVPRVIETLAAPAANSARAATGFSGDVSSGRLVALQPEG